MALVGTTGSGKTTPIRWWAVAAALALFGILLAGLLMALGPRTRRLRQHLAELPLEDLPRRRPGDLLDEHDGAAQVREIAGAVQQAHHQ